MLLSKYKEKNKYMYNINKKLKVRYVIFTAVTLFIASSFLFFSEKKGITNLYTSTPNSQITQEQFPTDTEGNRLTNTVDYSGPNSSDSVPILDKSTETSQPLPANSALSVVMTNSRKSGDDYLIKAVIAGTDSATCSATMTNGSLTASASSGATTIEGQYSCDNLFIPLSQLTESGEWNLVITVTDKAGAKASTNEKVIL